MKHKWSDKQKLCILNNDNILIPYSKVYFGAKTVEDTTHDLTVNSEEILDKPLIREY